MEISVLGKPQSYNEQENNNSFGLDDLMLKVSKYTRLHQQELQRRLH